MAYTPPKIFGDLPLELVEQIIGVLDTRETPSFRALRQEPSSAITHADIQPLKCLSRTCHSLRDLIVDRLFQTAVLNIDIQSNRKMQLHWKSELCAFQDFLTRDKLPHHLRSVVVQFNLQTPMGRKVRLNKGFAGHVCSTIVRLYKPETLTVVIPPALIPYLAPHGYPRPEHDDAWSSNTSSHVLTCVRSSKSPTMPTDSNLHPHLGLWKGRYSSITLNEASSINMYHSYEYYLKKPPSLFSSRQFQLSIQRDWHSWLREFTYIAIFPISSHVHDMFDILRDLYRLEILSVQFAREEFFSDLPQTGKPHFADLWEDFHECYRVALRFARHMSSLYRLRLFESLDWHKYAEIIKPDVQVFLRGWTFYDGSWKKPTGAMNFFS